MLLCLAVAALGVFVGYNYGAKVHSELEAAHHSLIAKLYAVKHEVELVELEAKAEEAKLVARLKALL